MFGAWPGPLLPKAGPEQLHPEPSRHAANGLGGPAGTESKKEQYQANLPKPRTEEKEPAGLTGGRE